MKRTKLEKEIEWLREYVGQCIDGENHFNIHEVWQWLDSLLVEEDE
jgi:hypothetical protein